MSSKLVVVIVIAALAVGVLAFASLGSTNPGPTGHSTPPVYVDSVTMDSAAFPDNTSATLNLRETGNATVTLTSYKVTDDNGNSYILTGGLNQLIQPSATATVNILIGSSCSSCTLSGTTFKFKSGQTYSITVYASDDQQFNFQITRHNSSYQESLTVGFGTSGNP